jgi:glyoxalase/bleomycin resistance protein/dioxygenase superfamily protein
MAAILELRRIFASYYPLSLIILDSITRRDLLAAVGAEGIAALISARGDAMEGTGNVKILFVAGFGPIVRDTGESRKLYGEVLGIPFKEESDSYLHTEALQGVKTFALWPLSQATQSCFGKDTWPDGIPVPQAWLEFDVDSVEKATSELESRGYRILIRNKKEPWGQTVTRFISPEGLLVGVTVTPLMREKK